MNIPSLDRPPTLEDFLRDETPAVSGRMAKLEGFVQRQPDDGEPATEPTEVYLGYTQRNLYVVFVAHDSQPERIRGRLEKRETVTLDEDQVGIYLDTFNDKRWGYQFSCNAIGVQDDSVYTENSGTWEESFDTVWDSRGALTSDGYVVWMSIPFKSLRFDATATHWGIAVWRWLPRRAEGSWWPRVSQAVRGFLSQEALADGFDHVSPGRNLQFIPYSSWRASRMIDSSTPKSSTGTSDVAGGADAKVMSRTVRTAKARFACSGPPRRISCFSTSGCRT